MSSDDKMSTRGCSTSVAISTSSTLTWVRRMDCSSSRWAADLQGTGGPARRHPRPRRPHATGRPTQLGQSTAIARAEHTWRILVSLNRPSRSTRTVRDTLSTESRFTAERRGTGSSPGSRTTSLTRPRMVVVHGAISARRCLGMTASRESTTTGRRPISAISHHQTSPRAGSAVTRLLRLAETMTGRPTRPARPAGARRRLHSSRRSRRRDEDRAERRVPRRRGLHRSLPRGYSEPPRGVPHPLSCSIVCEPCHHHAT